MTKVPVSSKFAKFAEKTTRGEFDKARKAESMASGCPLPVGVRGIAVVGTVDCTETKVKADGTGGDPFVSIKLEVESPEEYRGKILQGPGLMFVIKDGPNSTEADAWGRMLDTLEMYGLPRKLRTGYEAFSEVLDFFTNQPRRVEFNVVEDTYKGNQSGKIVKATQYVPEGEVQTAETIPTPQEDDPSMDYCTYLGKKHQILSHDATNDQYDLQQVGVDRPPRKGVPVDKVILL